MAAITVYDSFTGSSNPLSTGDGWRVTQGTGFQETGGYALPKSYAADQEMVSTTTYSEDATNWSTGLITKFEFEDTLGAWDDGTVWHCIVRWLDANNYDYVKVYWGGLSIYTDLNDDGVELWSVRSGVHAQVSASHAVDPRLSVAGHAGHYQFRNRSTTLYPAITVVCARDMYLIKATMKDPHHSYDVEDYVLMYATLTPATYNGAVGIRSVAGTQSIVCRSVKAQLVNVAWTHGATGNDANAGHYNAPYKTVKKLVEETTVNEYGFVRSGTYTETFSSGTATFPKGTSQEDKPWIAAYSNHVVNMASSYISVHGDYSYRGWCGLAFDAAYAVLNRDIFKLDAQAIGGTGATTKYWDWAYCSFQRPHGLNCIFIGQGTWYTGTAPYNQSPTTAEYVQGHRIYKGEMQKGSAQTSSNPGGGLYNEASSVLFEYMHSHDHGENGGRHRYGTSTGVNGVRVTNNNVTRFCKFYNNEQYGFYVGSGDGNVMDFNESYDNGTTDGSGLAVLAGATSAYVRCNIAYRNGATGTQHGNIVIESFSGGTITDVYMDRNTSYGGYNYGIANLQSGAGVTTGARITNNVDYGNTNTAFSTTGTASWATDANNWDDANGDPKFTDPTSSDFTLLSSSSLIEGGSAQAWTLTSDFWRRPSPQTVVIDIGATEFPDPPQENPVIVIATTAEGAITQLISLPGILIDGDGDALYVDGVFDALTPVVTATDSGTGVFETR